MGRRENLFHVETKKKKKMIVDKLVAGQLYRWIDLSDAAGPILLSLSFSLCPASPLPGSSNGEIVRYSRPLSRGWQHYEIGKIREALQMWGGFPGVGRYVLPKRTVNRITRSAN